MVCKTMHTNMATVGCSTLLCWRLSSKLIQPSHPPVPSLLGMQSWNANRIIFASVNLIWPSRFIPQYVLHKLSYWFLQSGVDSFRVGSYKYFVYSGVACACIVSLSFFVFSSTKCHILVSMKKLMYLAGLSHKWTNFALMVSICFLVHSTPGWLP